MTNTYEFQPVPEDFHPLQAKADNPVNPTGEPFQKIELFNDTREGWMDSFRKRFENESR